MQNHAHNKADKKTFLKAVILETVILSLKYFSPDLQHHNKDNATPFKNLILCTPSFSFHCDFSLIQTCK